MQRALLARNPRVILPNAELAHLHRKLVESKKEVELLNIEVVALKKELGR